MGTITCLRSKPPTGLASSRTTLSDSRADSSDADTMTRTISHTVVHKENDVMLMTLLTHAKTPTHHSADTTKTTQSVVSSKSPTDSASGLSVIWPTIRTVKPASCNQTVKSPVPTHVISNSALCILPTKNKCETEKTLNKLNNFSLKM